jgi:hypothetical protein
MDDDSGWDAVLVDGWGPYVRAAVVARIEQATVGRRGLLVRTVAAPDEARYAWTETVHRLVLDAIQAETGADLEHLGSQAAWGCYDDTWAALTARWATGGNLATVAPGDERTAVALVQHLPAHVAESAGADIGVVPAEPLRVEGRVRIDVEGLWACLAHDDGRLSRQDRVRISALLDRVERALA